MSARRSFPKAMPNAKTPRGGSRAGFTIVELLVALMIFAVGMLGLAATAGSVTKMMGGAKRQVIAANVAQSRLEKLRSSPCGTIVSGADTTRGIINTWTVTTVTRGKSVTDSLTIPMGRGQVRTRVYKTTLPC
jgi:prepilin-type N-terminal cleavage/methylation domain-containing protein